MKRKVCFLICPMDDPDSPTRRRSIRLRDTIIRPAMEGLDVDLEDFLDDRGSAESIRERMRQLIATADLCIADLTEGNPNVFFEYGLRRATGRPVLAFITEGQKLKYDVDDYYTQPYNLDEPAAAIGSLQTAAERIGFVRPTLRVDPIRRAQSQLLANHIAEKKPKRVDILQFSMLALRDSLTYGLWRSPTTIVRALLLHPEIADTYSRYGRDDVLQTTEFVRSLPDKTRRFAPSPKPPCATVGLWYYRGLPSVAAVIVDDSLIQLGWYFHEPGEDPDSIIVRGNDQPSVMAWEKDAQKLLEPIRDHFELILSSAEWVMGVGAGVDALRSEWETQSRAAQAGG
jgi:nucleoside 2-deoxyribosyltransferase